ncbi:NAD-dependent protein deacylase [Actinomycetaceae bacterium L2_0104]
MNELAEILANSKRIVFFGGAGMSTESGIPDFRSAGGLYNQDSGVNYAPEQVLSHEFFLRHTAEFYEYYRANLLHPQARPNAGHLALAQLESHGILSAVITQNIDGLHQAAGSQRVLELHGGVNRNTCLECERRFSIETIANSNGIPHCACGGIIKPDMVLYGEMLDEAVIDAACAELRAADTLIVGGTSLVVYPAAGLIRYFDGEQLVLINKQETPYDYLATLVSRDPIGEALGLAVSSLPGVGQESE